MPLSDDDVTWPFGLEADRSLDENMASVATRIATYNLPVSSAAMDYVKAHLNDPTFRRWRAMGWRWIAASRADSAS